ncbi:MAG: S9 family peptidase, partial [Saprospiraceae bacterium]
MKKIIPFILTTLFCMNLDAQSDLGYQKPPKEILDLVDVNLAPIVRLDSKAENMVFMYRDAYKSIQELSEKELRLGGLRINPVTNISSRARYYKDMKVRTKGNKTENSIKGLPENARLSNFSWSPNEKMMAFNNTTTKGVELWVLDVQKAEARRLTEDNLNANIGTPFTWFRDSERLLIKMIPSDKQTLKDTENLVPRGPVISENTDGTKAQNRTYQDLIKNPDDEFNFEQLTRSDLYEVSLTGKKKLWKKTAMHRGVSFSPDGKYIIVTEIKRPFSYLVQYNRFPTTYNIYDQDGKLVKNVLDVPLIEDLPQGFMSVRTGMRNLGWRADKDATLYWCEALDGGDPAKEVDFRDEVFEMNAPFSGKKKSLVKTKLRMYAVDWGDDSNAIVQDYWWNTRNTSATHFNPSTAKMSTKEIYNRNYQDRYTD